MPRARCSFIEEKCELQEIIAIACYRKFQRRKPWRRRGNYFPRIEYLYIFFKLRLTTIRETSKPSSFHIKYIPRTSVHLPLAQNPHRSTYTTRAPTNDKPRPLYTFLLYLYIDTCVGRLVRSPPICLSPPAKHTIRRNEFLDCRTMPTRAYNRRNLSLSFTRPKNARKKVHVRVHIQICICTLARVTTARGYRICEGKSPVQ